MGVWVNDVHSKFNQTLVREVVRVNSEMELQNVIVACHSSGIKICVSGGRHAMGRQQFGTAAKMLDLRGLSRILEFDHKNGRVTVEAGIEWPELVDFLLQHKENHNPQWGIRQKQTGADKLTLGGSLAANAHGRGLQLKPIVDDVFSFELIDHKGDIHSCSRIKNAELFSLAIGGYGLFGVISKITLQLSLRQQLRRDVEIICIDRLMPKFEERIKSGYLYGDFQFSCDENSNNFLNKGVFSCYKPEQVADDGENHHKTLKPEDWQRLAHLAHFDKSKAFKLYSEFYLSTSGQHYWSDTHQLSYYLDDYHSAIDMASGAKHKATEMISEIYVPRYRLLDFLQEAQHDCRRNSVNLFYGTIRLIEKDDESFLPWANSNYACVIFNLHTEHTNKGIESSIEAFRRLIDMSIRRRGNYYLTYHHWARKDQVEACYPQFKDFLNRKLEFDPEEIFYSDWYSHYKRMFGK